MDDLIKRNDALLALCGKKCGCTLDECRDHPCWIAKTLIDIPAVEPEDKKSSAKNANHDKCNFCKGRALSKKPVTITTLNGRKEEVVIRFCPECGRDLNNQKGGESK